ncbi:aspartate carbamoyltransferase catalytic subunit [Helicobacter cappadocius]|uniref:Aspartate carbamoyltransferase n=1 Tax=Helicobacter cappadocius TaxID=3063998 RepID=A0AA90PTQ8_9HELI|nr:MULTISPECIES: aspartate carbamoyltransferase catalytic subunit [unclassified Helicobacter]MDO7252702.1 aspartate carbamoyltransferase catalytic subunit [Helicobacter sp. faydin-H75]MDP2538570.1 aspartate carbamoyltransferase catalytic subunit [Helicobacter sp. faydin-H76]
MRHLIQTTDLDKDEINIILNSAKNYLKDDVAQTLKGKMAITIFFENSTRTLSSFEIALKRLGASVVRLDVSKSSTAKGESISDTAANLNAMKPNAIIIRHKNAGAGDHLSKYVSCPIINGGDGAHAHPTQALLDLFTIQNHFKTTLEGKRIAIIGDIKNSRVANSNIELLGRYGMKITLVAPPHFLPKTDLPTTSDITSIIDSVDVLMSLRTQIERHDTQTYGSLKDYAHNFCITKELIRDKNIIILHPGPVNRNIDIEDEVLKDSRCKVLEQVTNGVAVRMAVMEHFILNH